MGLETGMCLLHKHGNDCMLVSFHPEDPWCGIWTNKDVM